MPIIIYKISKLNEKYIDLGAFFLLYHFFFFFFLGGGGGGGAQRLSG